MRFSDQLINWYKEHKRDLPWRKTTDPYLIWLSEIILQQTRVDQGLDYFNRFVEHYPTVQELAAADEQEVLKLWQGLGYYSRARNLHFTAQFIAQKYNGRFPTEYAEIKSLKGVGEYTASAIASFAYGQPYAVVDGNVYRVLSRLFGVDKAIDSSQGKKNFNQLANEVLHPKEPALHNQAIMEFGALQCTPKQPRCESCPFRLSCYALINNCIDQLPYKGKKTKVNEKFFNYLILEEPNHFTINKRKTNGIWQGLYDFPLLETPSRITREEDLKKHFEKKYGASPSFKISNHSKEVIHLLSHQKIHAKFWHVTWPKANPSNYGWSRIRQKEINKYPVPKLIENYIKTIL